MTSVPDLAEPIAAWRVWRLRCDEDGPRLVSPATATVWPARIATTAVCRRGCPGPTPSLECSCGLYALAHIPTWGRRLYPGTAVLGCTALWGRVVEATDGWRGERGYPLVLFVRPTVPDLIDDPFDNPAAVACRDLGERYAVPVYPVSTFSGLGRRPATVATRAAAVRDEAAHGLAGRRRGDPEADRRLAQTVGSMLEALAP